MVKKAPLCNPGKLQSVQIRRQQKSHIASKNSKINPLLVKSVSESNCKPLRKSAIRENFNLKPKTQIKTHSNNRANYNRQNNEVKKNFQPVRFIYVWTIFEHQVKTKYASWKIQLVSCTRGPQTHFRNAQDPQLAGVLTVFIRSIQNTNVTLYEVESQKTVNTKSRKRTDWLSELIEQMFDHNFRENSTWKWKKMKVMLQCNAKAYQSILQTLQLKSRSVFEEQTRIHLKHVIEKLDVVRVKHVWATLEN